MGICEIWTSSEPGSCQTMQSWSRCTYKLTAQPGSTEWLGENAWNVTSLSLRDADRLSKSTWVIFGNVQSLCPKIDELRCLLATDHFDVISINESWLKFGQCHLLAEVVLQGYQLFSVEKPNPTGRGSCSVLYVRDAVDPIVKRKVSTLTCEIIVLQVQLRDHKILKLVLVYHNPHLLAAQLNAEAHKGGPCPGLGSLYRGGADSGKCGGV